MAKVTDSVDVIADSEEELPKPSSKKDEKDAKNSSKDEAASGNEEGGEDDEEYEIEAILDAKHGAFPGGRVGYLVKWKGYGDEHNSWVDHEDAGNATLLIDAFWKKKKKEKKGRSKGSGGRPRKSETREESPEADEAPSSKRKKGSARRKSKSSQPEDGSNKVDDEDEEEEEKPRTKKAKVAPAKPRSEERMDVDEEYGELQYNAMMEKHKNKKSWEALVDHVDTIEKIEGTLKVFFTLTNGDKVVENSQECAKYFPQKLIRFYESNLRWRESE